MLCYRFGIVMDLLMLLIFSCCLFSQRFLPTFYLLEYFANCNMSNKRPMLSRILKLCKIEIHLLTKQMPIIQISISIFIFTIFAKFFNITMPVIDFNKLSNPIFCKYL
jgi:hypothetical protein